MGMVVRTNMAALNANNSLQTASKAQQKGMEKLASGFKINKAADDASGLAISEKMKNQIKALDTAKDNCEDGANLIQTAEGYMSETHDMLTRMTELAEKSANGTLGDEDRKALQDEMDELCGEIDRIATTANFNGHKLLDGSLGSKEQVKIKADQATGSIKYSGPTKGTFNGAEIDIKDAVSNKGMKAGVTYTATDTASGGVDLYASGNYNATLNLKNGDLDDDTATTAIDETNITVNLGIKDGETVSIKKGEGSGGVVTTSGLTFTTNNDLASDKLLTFNKAEKKWYDQEGVEFTDISKIETAAVTGNQEFKLNEGINLQIGESSTAADRLNVNINSFHTDTLFAGLDGFVNSSADATNDAATAKVKIRGVDANGAVATDGSGNTSSTYKNAVSIDISNKDNASAAADAIRQISNYVSDERGKLGAQQNRLDHTVNNLTTASENTTAANSRIRDTDMAKEMMAYTSKNVIAQAAQSMLAQANSQPQNVLSLLQ